MSISDPKAPKVDFVVAGVQKSGTAALRHFLSQHPEIGTSHRPKQAPHFFDSDEYFQAPPDYDLYHSWFTPENLARVTGDITPAYTYWKPAIARIHAYNPRMKVIVLLRNPVDRAYSQWSMQVKRKEETDGFLTALIKEPVRRRLRGQHRIYSYVDRGYYSAQIERLLSYFPREQCLFLRNEDLRQDHHATLTRIHVFLGVSPIGAPEPEEIHVGGHTSMSPALRRALTFLYRREIKRLARLVDFDCSSWLTI